MRKRIIRVWPASRRLSGSAIDALVAIGARTAATANDRRSNRVLVATQNLGPGGVGHGQRDDDGGQHRDQANASNRLLIRTSHFSLQLSATEGRVIDICLIRSVFLVVRSDFASRSPYSFPAWLQESVEKMTSTNSPNGSA